VKKAIKNLKFKLFFVLDNVDSYEAISKYVDAVTENVKYLITTISKQYPNFYAKIELQMFATMEIEAFLKSNFEFLLKTKDTHDLMKKAGIQDKARPYKLNIFVAFLKSKNFVLLNDLKNNFN
jgi:hypothetical protein